MNFTREPLIETIISARDGHKLSVKSSKSLDKEEYLVDAVEVVSFGNTFFYRSQERAKAFFVPSSDYEIQEVKETRLVIKNPTIEKSVKIGGGKEAGKPPKQPSPTEEIVPVVPPVKEEELVKNDLKREKKRYRKNRKTQEDSQVVVSSENKGAEKSAEKLAAPVKVPVPGVFSHLLKPPETLISDSIERYRREDPNSPYHQNRTAEKGVVKEPSTTSSVKEEGNLLVPADDKELFSEPPKAGEQLEEVVLDDSSPLVFSRVDIEGIPSKNDGPNLSKEEE